jgi:hypothetical protein
VKRFFRLGLFALVVVLILGCFYGEANFFFNAMNKRGLMDMQELQKAQLALVLVSFHSYYHVWPGPTGPLGDDIQTELGGFKEAKINTQHINFFDRTGSDMDTLDSHGNDLYFKPDNSIGTCTVYENSK